MDFKMETKARVSLKDKKTENWRSAVVVMGEKSGKEAYNLFSYVQIKISDHK